MIYKSLRVGKDGKHFYLCKFRTFKKGMDGGSPTASSDDERMTKIGRFLRRTKLDELPTLWNLIKGEIAIVGPRPDVLSEIESLEPKVREIVLSVKPGLISPATLWNANEDEELKGEPDPHKAYCERIKPTKYKLNCWYAANRNWCYDVLVMLTFFARMLGIKKDVFEIYPKWLYEKK